jgi:hypothetical protein
VRLVTTRQTQTGFLWLVGLMIFAGIAIVVFDILAWLVSHLWPLIFLGIAVLPFVWIARRHVRNERRSTGQPADRSQPSRQQFRIRPWMIIVAVVLAMIVIGQIGLHTMPPVPAAQSVQATTTARVVGPTPGPIITPTPYIFPPYVPYVSPYTPAPALPASKSKSPKIRICRVFRCPRL